MHNHLYSKEKIWASSILGLIACLVGWDAWSDWRHGGSLNHVASEVLVVALTVAGMAALWSSSLVFLRRQLAAHQLDQARLQAEATAWKQSVADLAMGLSRMIDRQFETWGLTAAEKEVALLLLKGLSIREIAELRQVNERTVKQQNMAIYRKSKLTGRAELAAFFLEDLLAPQSSVPSEVSGSLVDVHT